MKEIFNNNVFFKCNFQISQNQHQNILPFNEQKVRASKHWTYPEEKILINLLLEKKNENPECFKVAYSVWSNITEAINKEFGSNRSVESIKKHYRKMRTKYFVLYNIYQIEKANPHSNWIHFTKMAEIVTSENEAVLIFLNYRKLVFHNHYQEILIHKYLI